MKIIVSHDVDHLYPSDHILRDLIFPKLWIRSSLEFARGKIGLKTWYYRIVSIFEERLNRIPEIVEFDKRHNIPSIFFFGMDNGLGLSYKKSASVPWIKFVLRNGFDAGVHGIEFDDIHKMRNEFIDFQTISNLSLYGIRTHFVQYNNNTFNKMADLGYLFDTSEYNKTEVELKPPYKIGNMWEFPLYIMDGYIVKNTLDSAKEQSIYALTEAKKGKLKYFTFLFHDYYFNEKTWPVHFTYYKWFVDYCLNEQIDFISYREAINELEEEPKNSTLMIL